jgi:hypothetical protein
MHGSAASSVRDPVLRVASSSCMHALEQPSCWHRLPPPRALQCMRGRCRLQRTSSSPTVGNACPRPPCALQKPEFITPRCWSGSTATEPLFKSEFITPRCWSGSAAMEPLATLLEHLLAGRRPGVCGASRPCPSSRAPLLFPLPLQLRLPLLLSYAGLSPFGVRASDRGTPLECTCCSEGGSVLRVRVRAAQFVCGSSSFSTVQVGSSHSSARRASPYAPTHRSALRVFSATALRWC